ncbi:MAG: hypothetical protein ABI718_18190, partial [Acidobacteriota bacterium]
TIVYRTDTSTGRLSLRSRLGAEQRLLDDKNVFYDLRVSGDGNRAAVSVVSRATGLADIWIYDLLRGVRERFTTEPWHEVTPVWSPDSTYIVYSEAAGGTLPHLVRRMLSGSSSQQVISPTSFQFAGSFSPDGQTLFYSEETANNRDDVFRLDMRTGKSERVLDSSFSEVEPNVSPDGRWLAYESDVTGQYEIYLLDLTATEQLRIRISSDGGSSPRWRHDGRELFLVGPGGKLMSAVPGARGWNDVVVKELFRLPDMKGFDVLPDGQSFLVMQGSAGPSDFLFHILLSGG